MSPVTGHAIDRRRDCVFHDNPRQLRRRVSAASADCLHGATGMFITTSGRGTTRLEFARSAGRPQVARLDRTGLDGLADIPRAALTAG